MSIEENTNKKLHEGERERERDREGERLGYSGEELSRCKIAASNVG